MECPSCGRELIDEGDWGIGLYFRESNKEEGRIYKCTFGHNSEYLMEDEIEEVLEFMSSNREQTIEEIMSEEGWESLEDVICTSNVHNGLFYTKRTSELIEGYPC